MIMEWGLDGCTAEMIGAQASLPLLQVSKGSADGLHNFLKKYITFIHLPVVASA